MFSTRQRAATALRRAEVDLRLWIGVHVRRCLPTWFTRVLVTSRSWLGRRRPGRRDTAVANIEFVLGAEVPPAELEVLVDAQLIRASWRRETRWRPGLMDHQEVVGLEHLDEALARGRGCLLSFVHHGDSLGGFLTLANAGHPIGLMTVSQVFGPDAPLHLKVLKRAIESAPGMRALDVAGGSALVRDELRQGHLLAIAIDPAGHTPTQFLGRTRMLSSGGIRVAVELDVPVLPVTSRRPQKRWGAATAVIARPLHPRDFESPEALHAEVARQLEAAVLAWPEAMDQPVGLTSAERRRTPTTYDVPASHDDTGAEAGAAS